jgi:hypothetical protein
LIVAAIVAAEPTNDCRPVTFDDNLPGGQVPRFCPGPPLGRQRDRVPGELPDAGPALGDQAVAAIVQSLAANGVVTAADFTGITYSGGPRAGAPRVLIRLRNGNYVHPNGVGEKKAAALDSWRRTLEMRARATQPSRLTSIQAQAIQAKYEQRRQDLANEEQTAQARSARQAFAQERVQVNAQLAAVQKQSSGTTWKRDLAAREILAHRNVNYLRYITSCAAAAMRVRLAPLHTQGQDAEA